MKIRMDYVYPSKHAELCAFLNNKDSAAWVKWEDILPEEFKAENEGPIEIIFLKGVNAKGTTSFQVDLEVREKLVARKRDADREEFVWTVPSSHLRALLGVLGIFPQLNVEVQADILRQHMSMLQNIQNLSDLVKNFYNSDKEVMGRLLREIEEGGVEIKRLTQELL